MGKRYVQHDDMCGCERCAVQWDREDGPSPVFDEIEDPNVCDHCGWDLHECRCWEDTGDHDDGDD